MKTWLRAKPRGLLGFVLIATLVAGGLGWASTAALRLEQDQHAARAQAEFTEKRQTLQRERDQKLHAHERARQQQQRTREREQQQQEAQTQAEFAGRLRLAMWRLDSRIARVLVREDARPYNHYSAMFTPSVVLDVPLGKRVMDGAVCEPSPLLCVDLPDWMLLHFQTALETDWGSPQVLPLAYQKLLSKNHICFSNVTRQRIQLLAELSSIDTTQTLLQGIERQELQFALANNDVLANPVGLKNQQELQQAQQPQKDLNALLPKQQSTAQPQNNYGNSLEYSWRIQQRSTINNESLRNYTYGEGADILTANTNRLGTWGAPQPSRPTAWAQVSVSLSPMVPLWLQTPDQERLVVARLVRISSPAEEQLTLLAAWPPASWPLTMAALGTHEQLRKKAKQPQLVCQGIVLDWPRLETLLADEVRDLFPRAKVRPMRAAVPPHPECTMTALPVELDPGETPFAPPAPLEAVETEPAVLAAEEPVLEVTGDLGWTPLRIGLALAWAAALVALTAVGLGGWSVLDLSERRIRFVSAVTHELRTPLTTLRLYLDMLTGGLVKTEEQRSQYLHTLHAETERLNRLVGNVLDFSRLENQRPRLELAPVRVGDLLEQLRMTWQTRCTDTEKVLVLENALGDDCVLVTDVNLVQQIVGNLIDNACKYSRGAENPHLWVRVKLGDAQRVRVEVEDRGPGVKASERCAIFRPFHRGRDCELAGGVGLGLALAQRWAGLLGGRLMLATPVGGVGACFVLELGVIVKVV